MANVLKTLKGPLSTLGKKNRNGRIYSKELWENVLGSEYWKDMMTNNSLCGEVCHPGDNRTETDGFEVDISKVSHRVKEAHIEGDKLMGTIEILDTTEGRNLLSLVDAGVTVGISARGVGDVIGDEVDPDTYSLKTFDITLRPSDPNARLVPLTESERLHLKFIDESEETDELLKEDPEVNTEAKVEDSFNKRLNDRLAYNYANKHKGDDIDFSRFELEVYPTTSDTNAYRISVYDKNTGEREIIDYIDKDLLGMEDADYITLRSLEAMSAFQNKD